jgi:hypothetical protein
VHPLNSYSPVVAGKFGHFRLACADWVLQCTKELYCFLGVLCEGFEKFLALLTTIEAGCPQQELGSYSLLAKALGSSKCWNGEERTLGENKRRKEELVSELDNPLLWRR